MTTNSEDVDIDLDINIDIDGESDSQQPTGTLDTQKKATPPALPSRPDSIISEEIPKTLVTPTRKARTLRHMLGRYLIERSCKHIQKDVARFANLLDAPVPTKKGTSPKFRSQRLPAPRYCCRKRREMLKHTPLEIWGLLIEALKVQTQPGVEDLAYRLVQQVVEEKTLAGYSAVAIVAGCMQFAAGALEAEIQFAKKKLDEKGLTVNTEAIRCAYNALWWERRRFKAVLEEHGTSVEVLKWPITPDGNVAGRILNADAMRLDVEMEHNVKERGGGEGIHASIEDTADYGGKEIRSSIEEQGAKDDGRKRSYLTVEESHGVYRKPSRLANVESAPDEPGSTQDISSVEPGQDGIRVLQKIQVSISQRDHVATPDAPAALAIARAPETTALSLVNATGRRYIDGEVPSRREVLSFQDANVLSEEDMEELDEFFSGDCSERSEDETYGTGDEDEMDTGA